MKVLAIIFDGFEELEATAPFALLRRANIDLDISSYNTTVTGSHNISITNVLKLKELNYTQYDCLLIPGGAHYKQLTKETYVHNIIKYFIEENKVIATICAAPTILGMLGYLENKKYTCFTAMNQDFKGVYTDNGVEVDENIITAKSAAYSIDFAYAIIEKLIGKAALIQLQKKIYYEK